MGAVNRALVVGGGIGGLTAGVALRRAGVAVDLVEIQERPTVYGVGIIQPNNTLRALDRIGLADTCVRMGGAFPGWRIFDAGGSHLMDAPNPSEASPRHPPVNGLTRPVLQKILTDAAIEAGVSFRNGTTVRNLSHDGGVEEVEFADGRRERYQLVVACDGMRSSMRPLLFGGDHEPKYTGLAVWRYNFHRPPRVQWGEIHFGAHAKAGLVPMSPSQMYMFVVTAEPAKQRIDPASLAAELRHRLREFTGFIAELRELIEDSAAVVYRPIDTMLLPSPWNKGHTILIGDAAHTTTPHLAQGAAMAIEDAVLLAELVGARSNLEAVFEEFMKRRFERVKYVVDCSLQLAAWEVDEFSGRHDPEARPGGLLHEATMALMKDY
jgi:2-polyprenyl-6-methoxyphenol hydroxylase-like FAD-dependent oxidoreductase